MLRTIQQIIITGKIGKTTTLLQKHKYNTVSLATTKNEKKQHFGIDCHRAACRVEHV